MPKNPQPEPKPADSQAPVARSDERHPEVHPDRHPANGMQEITTVPGATQNPDDAVAGGGAGAKQVEVDPNPSIGVTHSPGEATGPGVNEPDDDAEHVFSYEQALSLPVVGAGEGTPVKMPSDATLRKLHAKQRKEQEEAAESAPAARGADDDARPAPADTDVPLRRPIVSFKDRDRRTMVVVKTKDGLAARPSDDFKDAPAPNA